MGSSCVRRSKARGTLAALLLVSLLPFLSMSHNSLLDYCSRFANQSKGNLPSTLPQNQSFVLDVLHNLTFNYCMPLLQEDMLCFSTMRMGLAMSSIAAALTVHTLMVFVLTRPQEMEWLFLTRFEEARWFASVALVPQSLCWSRLPSIFKKWKGTKSAVTPQHHLHNRTSELLSSITLDSMH